MQVKLSKKLYILDVSGYVFRAYYALPPMTNQKGEATHALFGFIRSTLKLIKELNPEHIVAVFDGPDNKKQRQDLYEKYKANRTRVHEDLPAQMEWAKIFCELIGIQHIEVGGVEADDTMGSIAMWAACQDATVYLCTSDKDLCQLVSSNIFILNTWKDNLIIDAEKVEELYGVSPKQIVDLLAIMGDSSDNIPGLSGFGSKTAVLLLKEFGSLESLLAHPEMVKGTKKQETLRAEAEIARLSYRLATIHTDIDFPKEASFFAKLKPDVANLKDFYLEMSFASLAKELDSLFQTSEEPKDYQLVDTDEAFEDMIDSLLQEKEIAFSLATTANDRPLSAGLVGFSFSISEGEAYYIPLNGRLEAKKILEALNHLFTNPSLSFSTHHVKFQFHILQNYGIHPTNLHFDTTLASYLLNSSSKKHTLEHLMLHYFGKVKIALKDLAGVGKKEIAMEEIPLKNVCAYFCEEADYIFRIQNLLKSQLKKRKLEPLLYNLELPLSKVLGRMEREGMYLEKKLLIDFAKEVERQIQQIETQIYDLAQESFNISSPKQLSSILFEKMGIKPVKKTATGLSTNADVLEALSKEHPIAECILVYRTLEKLRSTYLEPLLAEINPITQRIHPTFNQFVAATGRLACQDPNLQNIPVRTAQGRRIREAFRPQKNHYSYLSADYSQIELRLLAHLSEDPQLLKAFNEGDDIHAATAARVFGVPLERVSKAQRNQAKAINFGIIYGQQAYGLSQELKIDVKEAFDFIEAYFIRYPKVLEFINSCIETARKTGKSTTMIGRERDLVEIHSRNTIVRNAAERLAINTPLQGSAADLIKLAMLEIDRLLLENKMEAKMILQIHDELIFESPDNELAVLTDLVKTAMEGVFSLKVPLIVDVNIGKNWAEC